MKRLDGKVAIVTGAGQGIGLAYARRLLAEGARVVLAEIDAERGRAAVAQLGQTGDAVFVQTDIADSESAVECVERTVEQFGTVDVLVNNAALFYDIDHRRNDPSYLRHVFDVNLHGAWLMSRAASNVMTAQARGRIVNQSSAAAYLYQSPRRAEFAELGAFAYGQSKWGIIGLTKFLAGQLGQYKVTVNCIVPGLTTTEASRRQVGGAQADALLAMTAMGRALEPDDLTGALVFFASDDAAFVTGQVLCVDGGLCMPG